MISPLETIPGIGKSITKKLNDISIYTVEDLIGQNPDELYHRSNIFAGLQQDRCLLYTFRCAIYFVETPKEKHKSNKLKRRNWKDNSL